MTAIEDRLRDLRRSVSPPDLPTADQVARRGRRRRRQRRAVGMLGALTVLALVPLVLVRLNGDEGRVVSGDPSDALATVRAAVGQTVAAGSYEMDTVTTTSQPETGSCDVLAGPDSSPTESWCVTSGARTNQITADSIVNLEPYAMVSETNNPNLGPVTLHVNSTHVWQLGGASVGYGPGNPGMPLTEYSQQVLGTLGRGPGALAMISIASRGGYLNLEEEAVASAEPAGTGTVGDVPVTYYDVTVDMTRLADAPNLSDIQRQTIAAALPLLEESGYRGTAERIGVDEMGYVREINSTTNFDDGSTSVRHSVLSNFGCAPKVYMPNETPPPATTPPPCPTTTMASPSTTTTALPSTTTAGSDDAAASCGTRPYFRPAPGWEAVQAGIAATAANVPLGPATLAGDMPWDTVERLADGDVVVFAMLYPDPLGEVEASGVDSIFPPHELPLSLDDAELSGFEGQPDHIYGERLGAQVGDWNIDLLVFYGGGDPATRVPLEPSAETRAAAQEQLARLEVPPPC